MDYAALQALIASRIHRTDLTTEIKSFIELAESRIGRNLRGRTNIVNATLTTVAGTNPTTLPGRFEQLKELSFVSGGSRQVLRGFPRQKLPIYFTRPVASSGQAQAYSIVGLAIEIRPEPGDFSFDFIYWERPSPLTDSVPNNATLSAHPELYLKGALIEAWNWIQNEKLYRSAASEFGVDMDDINGAAAKGSAAGFITASP